MKTSKIQLGYYSQENAVRISAVSKVGVTDKTNACTEGIANCGENTICVPLNDDGYEVNWIVHWKLLIIWWIDLLVPM